jgi:hypothetical protein
MASASREDDSLYASSIGEQLSPTGGYSDSRQRSHEEHVHTSLNPETRKNGGASVAALLRSALSSSSANSGARRTYSSSSIMSDETAPLLGRTTPPPAYTPETPQSAYPYLGNWRFSELRSLSNGSPFYPTSSLPQTMRDAEANPIDNECSRAPGAGWRRKGRTGSCSIRAFMKVVTCLGLLVALIWTIIGIREYNEPKVNTSNQACSIVLNCNFTEYAAQNSQPIHPEMAHQLLKKRYAHQNS